MLVGEKVKGSVGLTAGIIAGCGVGMSDVGGRVTSTLGWSDGTCVGSRDGEAVGTLVGNAVGIDVGIDVGTDVGTCVGIDVGADVGDSVHASHVAGQRFCTMAVHPK